MRAPARLLLLTAWIGGCGGVEAALGPGDAGVASRFMAGDAGDAGAFVDDGDAAPITAASSSSSSSTTSTSSQAIASVTCGMHTALCGRLADGGLADPINLIYWQPDGGPEQDCGWGNAPGAACPAGTACRWLVGTLTAYDRCR